MCVKEVGKKCIECQSVFILLKQWIVVAFNDYNFKVIDLDKDLYSVVERIEGIEESIVENTEELRYLLDNKFLVKKRWGWVRKTTTKARIYTSENNERRCYE